MHKKDELASALKESDEFRWNSGNIIAFSVAGFCFLACVIIAIVKALS